MGGSLGQLLDEGLAASKATEVFDGKLCTA